MFKKLVWLLTWQHEQNHWEFRKIREMAFMQYLAGFYRYFSSFLWQSIIILTTDILRIQIFKSFNPSLDVILTKKEFLRRCFCISSYQHDILFRSWCRCWKIKLFSTTGIDPIYVQFGVEKKGLGYSFLSFHKIELVKREPLGMNRKRHLQEVHQRHGLKCFSQK